jgi:hypothetical protein
MNDRFSFIKSEIPKALQYPVSDKAVHGARVTLNLMYGAGIARKLNAAKQGLKLFFGKSSS